MIVFDKLWTTMEKKGISTYQLREKCGIDSKTIRRLRANEDEVTFSPNISPERKNRLEQIRT